MLPIRRRDALSLAVLVALAMAARPVQAGPFGVGLYGDAALAASAQDDEDLEAYAEDEAAEDEAYVEDEAVEDEAVEDEAYVEDEDEADDEAAEEDLGASPEEDGIEDAPLLDEDEAAEDGTESIETGAETTDDEFVYVEDYEDDSWAPELGDDVEEYEDDDAIAFDEQYDEEWVWEVVAVEDGNGLVEDREQRDVEDGFSIGQILQVSGGKRTGVSSADGLASGNSASGTRRAERSGSEPAGDDAPYAFGGRPVAARAVPWQAQIFNPGVARNPDNPRPIWMRQHNCGGALIADDWVLTAAHCIDQQRVDLGFKVRLGAQDISQGDGLVYRIERIVRHSQYDQHSQDLARPPNMYANDIALIRIVPDGTPQRRDPRFIRPISLNRAPLADGIPVTVTGWGAVGAGATNEGSALILRVDLRLMDQKTCASRPRRGGGKVHPKVFCAASPTQSTCSGDSGGPVVPTNGPPVLAGLVSWGSTRCGGDGLPALYTRVDQYLGWIEQAMRLPATRNSLP